MNKVIFEQVMGKIKEGTATKEDYIALIKEIYGELDSGSRMAIIGMFQAQFGITQNLKESFDYVNNFYYNLVKTGAEANASK